jgi:putative transposase
VLLEKIETIHRNSWVTYGAPRIHAELRALGIRCGRKRVARLMRRAELRGCLRDSRQENEKRSSQNSPANCSGSGRQELRCERAGPAVGCVHNLRPFAGWLRVSCLYPRCLQPEDHGLVDGYPSRTELVVDTLQLAITRRKPSPEPVQHSDRGVQYTSLSFGNHLQNEGLVPSMGRVGSA